MNFTFAVLTSLFAGATATAITLGMPALAGLLCTGAVAWFCTLIMNLQAAIIAGQVKSLSK